MPTAKRLEKILSLEDFEPVARRVLPRSIFSFIAGGAETDASLRANRQAFLDIAFSPRVLVDVSKRSTATQLFGKRFEAPFGIAPMGGAGLAGYHADIALARAAAAANVPFVLSGSSLIALERIIKENPQTWFQAYFSVDRGEIGALVDRVAAANYHTLVITADVPVPGNREHLIRRGYTSPLRPNPGLLLDALSHPRWLVGTALRTLLTTGMPHHENYGADGGVPVFSRTATRSHIRDSLSWKDVEWVRGRWKGHLVIKGILAASDARTAREVGADAVVVSNHGGRQLDGAVAPLRVLPRIAEEARGMSVFYDSGIRRGTDVIKALALGAHFVFVGRPFLYAAAVAGAAGVLRAVDLLRIEVDRDLALLGCRSISELSARIIESSGAPMSPLRDRRGDPLPTAPGRVDRQE